MYSPGYQEHQHIVLIYQWFTCIYIYIYCLLNKWRTFWHDPKKASSVNKTWAFDIYCATNSTHTAIAIPKTIISQMINQMLMNEHHGHASCTNIPIGILCTFLFYKSHLDTHWSRKSEFLKSLPIFLWYWSDSYLITMALGPLSVSYLKSSKLASHLDSSSIPSNLWSFLSDFFKRLHKSLGPKSIALFWNAPYWHRHVSASTLLTC